MSWVNGSQFRCMNGIWTAFSARNLMVSYCKTSYNGEAHEKCIFIICALLRSSVNTALNFSMKCYLLTSYNKAQFVSSSRCLWCEQHIFDHTLLQIFFNWGSIEVEDGNAKPLILTINFMDAVWGSHIPPQLAQTRGKGYDPTVTRTPRSSA